MTGKLKAGERGGSKLSLLLTVLIVGALVFIAVKIVPPYVNNFQLQDAIQTEARFALANRKSPDDVHSDVWKKVQELGVPAKEDDVVVIFQEGTVAISVDYNVTVDLLVYQWNIPFHPHADNHSI